MPRQVRISKERILEAALGILIRDGFCAVNIKSVANELSCSTQPIAWQFKKMENMREALAQEAVAYANQKLSPLSVNAIEAFWQLGKSYIDLAFDTPNLFRFLYMGESQQYLRGGLGSILTDKGNAALIERLAKQLGASEEQAGEVFQRMVLYTHGIVSLVVAGVLDCTRKQAYESVLGFAFDMLEFMDMEMVIESVREIFR